MSPGRHQREEICGKTTGPLRAHPPGTIGRKRGSITSSSKFANLFPHSLPPGPSHRPPSAETFTHANEPSNIRLCISIPQPFHRVERLRRLESGSASASCRGRPNETNAVFALFGFNLTRHCGCCRIDGKLTWRQRTSPYIRRRPSTESEAPGVSGCRRRGDRCEGVATSDHSLSVKMDDVKLCWVIEISEY